MAYKWRALPRLSVTLTVTVRLESLSVTGCSFALPLLGPLALGLARFGGTDARFVTLPSLISAVCIASNLYLANSWDRSALT